MLPSSLLESLKPFIIFPCQVIASVNIYFLKPSGRNTHENNGFFLQLSRLHVDVSVDL